MSNETLINQIVEGNLQTLWNLLCTYKDESKELKKAYTQVKHGISIKFHINYLLRGNHIERMRSGEVLLLGNSFKIEEFWEEEENREVTARKALLTHFEEDDDITQGR